MQTSILPEDSYDEFEQLKDQLLMYTFSEQIPVSTPHVPTRKKTRIKQEKPKLELLRNQKTLNQEDPSELNKNKKKVQCHIGKIIKVGNAIFKSNFESGNIGNVEQIGAATYKIDMQKEINSNRMSAWFYFSCQGLKGEVNFVLEGFTKRASLYNEGMKVCFREIKDGTKWRRGCTKISYCPLTIGDEQTGVYQLKFSHFFKTNEYSCVQFAYCFPYSFKKLHSFITLIKQSVKCQSLGKSFDGREIPLITIGNPQSQKVIVLSARVHPGQTVSSFIMEGFLRQLVGESQFGTLLRDQFLFKIVPMLNPDGVARGNYRFSTSGYDLNRKWKNCTEKQQPQIYFIKEMIRKVNKQKKVVMYIDMHGHSRKKNVFFYGCCQNGNDEEDQEKTINSKPKQFPYLMEKISDAFKYENCSFAVQKDKDGTARIAMWKQLKIDYVYTLESTFCGNQYGSNYLQVDYQKIGRKLCEGIATFFYDQNDVKIPPQKLKLLEKVKILKKNAQRQLKQSKYLLNMGRQDNSGSDSQPEKGQVPEIERNTQTGLPNQLSQISSVKNNRTSIHIIKPALKATPKSMQKYKSESANSQQINKLIMRNAELQKTLEFQPFRFDKPDIKISNNINTFELDALKSSALHQKNVRVHSLSRNINRVTNKMACFQQQENGQLLEDKFHDRIKINLMHVRQGAQYRRVRKMAEQNNRRETSNSSDQVNMVRGLANNNIQIQKSKTIAPRFYPISQQRNRRTSAEMYFKRQVKLSQFDGKRLSINGDELNVRCLGNKIYF